MKVKQQSEKVGLKLNNQETKIMASGPITSWLTDGETVSNFIFGGSKITADGVSTQKIQGLLTNAIETNKFSKIGEPKVNDKNQLYL